MKRQRITAEHVPMPMRNAVAIMSLLAQAGIMGKDMDICLNPSTNEVFLRMHVPGKPTYDTPCGIMGSWCDGETFMDLLGKLERIFEDRDPDLFMSQWARDEIIYGCELSDMHLAKLGQDLQRLGIDLPYYTETRH